ncbi:hypothetical protein [Tunturiibacter gelidoferens]|uniref:Uncharacterized protein n=1 Tax=Tunturiibacter gelidiferens TaxID=3069689 RepID=A0ACC5P5U3_9BACT|nr:hypothetical protein [Edaphobacter lichenicola]MBB5342003.1 hypothetical protein [Edaphobacter lichenicola]
MSEIKIHAQTWNALSVEDKISIERILKDTKLLAPNDTLTADAAVVAPTDLPATDPFCKIACDIAEAAAVTACGSLSGPAVPICIAAAHAAGDFCRSKC